MRIEPKKKENQKKENQKKETPSGISSFKQIPNHPYTNIVESK